MPRRRTSTRKNGHPRTATKHPTATRSRKDRPCCGRRYDKCTCKAPPGMCMKPLNALAKRFLTTSLSTVQDTTDVSAWQTLMRDRCETLPTKVILGYGYIHVVFNQPHLLKAMVKEKAFTFRSPWVNWKQLQKIVSRARADNQVIRSSNYYSATLRNVILQSGHNKVNMPKNPVARDVLACKLVGSMQCQQRSAISMMTPLHGICGRLCCSSGRHKLTTHAQEPCRTIT